MDYNHLVLIGRDTVGIEKLLRPVMPDVAVLSINPAYPTRDLPYGERTLVVFGDGEKVHPSRYGAEVYSMASRRDEPRDQYEMETFLGCLGTATKMLGIGRGCILMWVGCGGDVYQYVNYHQGRHRVVDVTTGATVYVSSFHTEAPCASQLTGSPGPKVLALDNGVSNCRVKYDPLTGRMIPDRPSGIPIYGLEAWARPAVNPLMLGVMWRPDKISCPVSGRRLFYQYLNELLKG